MLFMVTTTAAAAIIIMIMMIITIIIISLMEERRMHGKSKNGERGERKKREGKEGRLLRPRERRRGAGRVYKEVGTTGGARHEVEWRESRRSTAEERALKLRSTSPGETAQVSPPRAFQSEEEQLKSVVLRAPARSRKAPKGNVRGNQSSQETLLCAS